MNHRAWTLTGLEFRILLEQFGRDRLPFPLQFRPSANTAAEYHRQRHEASVAVDATMDDDLRTATYTLLDPHYRIEIVGHSRPRGGPGGAADVKIRAHAAVGHSTACVLIQQPGLDESSGGAVSMSLLDAYRAVDTVLGALPDAEKGRSPRIDVVRETGSTGHFHHATGATDREQFDRLLAQPRSSAGEILVCPGRATDSRVDAPLAGFHWIDNVDDGRYLIKSGSTVSVVAGSVVDAAAHVRRLVAEIAATL